MAKARKIKGLKPHQRAGKAAALALQARLEDLLAELPLAYTGEVEGIHDARIAAKRLREMLRLARKLAPPAEFARFLALLQALNDHLGEVRDRDVMAEHLQALAAEKPALQASLQPLLQRLASERQQAFEALLPELERFGAEAPPLAASLIQQVRHNKHGAAGKSIFSLVHKQLARRLRELFDEFFPEDLAHNPRAFHRARIAVKKARYCLEPWVQVLPPQARRLRNELAELQEEMGLAHDLTVLAEKLKQLSQEGLEVPPSLQRSLEEAIKAHTRTSLNLFRTLSSAPLHKEVLTLLV